MRYLDSIKITKIGILFWLIGLFAIVPAYIYIGSLNIIFLYPLFLVIILFIRKRSHTIHNIFSGYWFVWGYLIIISIFEVIGSGLLKGTITFISDVILSYMLIILLSSEEKIHKFIDLLIGTSLILIIFSFIEAFTGVNIFQNLAPDSMFFFQEQRLGIFRTNSVFAQPINYGNYLLIISALIIYRINCSNVKNKKLLKFIYILTIISEILTISRSTIIMFIILNLLIWLIMKKNSTTFYMVLLLIPIGLGMILLMGQVVPVIGEFGELFLSIFLNENDYQTISDSTTNIYKGWGDRLDLYKWVKDDVGASWLFGKGSNAKFNYKVTDWFTKTSIENEYLNTFFHYGIVGVILEVLAILSVILQCRKNRRCKFKSELVSLSTVIICVMLVEILLFFTCGISNVSILFIFVICLSIAYTNIREEKFYCSNSEEK